MLEEIKQETDEAEAENKDREVNDYYYNYDLGRHLERNIRNVRYLLQELEKLQQDNRQIKEERDSWERVAFKVGQEKLQLQQENERYKEVIADIQNVIDHKVEMSTADKAIQDFIHAIR